MLNFNVSILNWTSKHVSLNIAFDWHVYCFEEHDVSRNSDLEKGSVILKGQ